MNVPSAEPGVTAMVSLPAVPVAVRAPPTRGIAPGGAAVPAVDGRGAGGGFPAWSVTVTATVCVPAAIARLPELAVAVAEPSTVTTVVAAPDRPSAFAQA